MSNRSEIHNLVKKSVLSGVVSNLYIIRSLYMTGDNAQAEFLFAGLIDSLKEYEREVGQENSVF